MGIIGREMCVAQDRMAGWRGMGSGRKDKGARSPRWENRVVRFHTPSRRTFYDYRKTRLLSVWIRLTLSGHSASLELSPWCSWRISGTLAHHWAITLLIVPIISLAGGFEALGVELMAREMAPWKSSGTRVRQRKQRRLSTKYGIKPGERGGREFSSGK